MENPNLNASQPVDASMSGVATTLEQVRDALVHMAMELRDLQFSLESPERQAALEKTRELIAKIQPG
jgi:hypothetical protein